ncbi:hypothetical protein BH20ACT15_BH20ACT15_10740 [soil metagenome]
MRIVGPKDREARRFNFRAVPPGTALEPTWDGLRPSGKPARDGRYQGNKLCEERSAELDQEADEAFQSNDPEALDAFVTDTLVPNVQGQIDALRDGIPEGDEDTVNAILDDAEAVLGDLEADPKSLQQGEPFAEINPRLQEYGLTACA